MCDVITVDIISFPGYDRANRIAAAQEAVTYAWLDHIRTRHTDFAYHPSDWNEIGLRVDAVEVSTVEKVIEEEITLDFGDREKVTSG